MLTRFTTVAAITAAMAKMVTRLQKLAEQREELCARELAQAEELKRAAEANYAEAKKARNVAAKIEELVS